MIQRFSVNPRVFMPCIFVFLFCTTSFAQTDSILNTAPNTTVTDTIKVKNQSDSLYRINGRYFKSIWLDFKDVVKRPIHWNKTDWTRFGVVTASGALLMVFADSEVRTWVLNHQNENAETATAVVEPFGNRLPPILLGGMYLTGLISGNRKLESSSLSITRAVMISTALYTVTKAVIRRERPVRTDNPYLFAPPFTHDGYTSFPSGHSNTVFSVATAFALEYKEHKWVPWVVYPIAALTAVARIYENRHWASDVLIGASFGHFVTRAVYKAEEKRKQGNRFKMVNP